MLQALAIVGVLAVVLLVLAVLVGLPVFSLFMTSRHSDSAETGRRLRALGKH